MELEKKTTILFSPTLHERLVQLARHRGVSLGHLVREACVRQYGLVSAGERLAAAETLRELSLPVGTPEELEQESVPHPDELMP